MQPPNHSSLLALINYLKSVHCKIIIQSIQLKSYLLFSCADVALRWYHYLLVFHQYWYHALHNIYRIIRDGLLECTWIQFNCFFFPPKGLVEIFYLSIWLTECNYSKISKLLVFFFYKNLLRIIRIMRPATTRALLYVFVCEISKDALQNSLLGLNTF